MNLKDRNQNEVIWPKGLEMEDEVVEHLKKTPSLYGSCRKLNGEWRKRSDRLSRLISSLLGIEVKIVHILPNEDSLIDGDTLLIMDLLGELEDGSLINVEIQKQSYAFPAERISCYSSDLVMRQYARVKGVKGSAFTYFHKTKDRYIHHGKTTFDTGLPLELLEDRRHEN